jgi:hypothetical protein
MFLKCQYATAAGTTPFCKSDRRPYSVDVAVLLRVTVLRDDVTSALRRHGDAPPTVLRRPLGRPETA